MDEQTQNLPNTSAANIFAPAFLVIDDETLVLLQLVRILHHAFPDSRIATAGNGIDGLHIARTERIDVVILDVSMPEMDGIQICRHLKKNPATAGIKVLMISGIRRDPQSKEEAFTAGADDYLLKPVDTEDLIFHVKTLLRWKKTDDQLAKQREEFEAALARQAGVLYAREKMFRELVESLPEIVLETDADLKLRYMNPAGLRAFGYAATDLERGLMLQQLLVFSARQAEAHIRQVLDGETIEPYEYLAVHRDGMRWIVRGSFVPIVDGGAVRGLRGMLIDISAVKQLQQELLASQESYRSLFDNMFDAVCVVEALANGEGRSRGFRLAEVNVAFAQLFDKRPEELVGKLLNDVVAEAGDLSDALATVVTTGQTMREERYIEELGQHLQISAFRPRLGAAALIWQDITDRKIAEERERDLQQQQAQALYLETVAKFASRAAHELNNILGPILCYPDMILAELPPDTSVRDDLLTIRDAARRAVEVIEELAISGQSGMAEKTPAQVNETVTNFINSSLPMQELQAKYPGLECRLELAPDLPAVALSGGQIRYLLETIANLAAGRERAAPNLFFATRLVTVTEPRQLCVRRLVPGEYVQMEIRDATWPLDERQTRQALGLAFEPQKRQNYQSLKLSLLHSALKQSNSYMDVRQPAEGGMLFDFYFALHGKTPQPEGEILRGHGETILVVDDVPAQCQMARRVLTELGYEVITAGSGAEAVEILQNRQNSGRLPNLVLLDMVMPQQDGLDTLKAIRALHPAQKCVIATGYARSERVQEARALGIAGFIRKPYLPERLAGVIAEALQN